MFHWFLPTGGDDRAVGPASHGGIIGDDSNPSPKGLPARESAHLRPNGFAAAARPPVSPTGRPATLDYLTQIAQAADTLGYEGVLTPTGVHCEDAWLTTAALIAATRRLKFLVAFRPGLVSPVLAAQMAATFQRLSAGRLLLNVVAGSSSAEQRGYGDMLDHDARYERATEFLDIVRAAWTGSRFDHTGAHYLVEGGILREPPPVTPVVYLGGSSPAAVEVAARHADVYLTWGEPIPLVADKIATVRAAAARQGRTIRFGIRLHVITRDTADRAWQDAAALIAGLDDDTIRGRQESLRRLESVGQQRMLDLHGGSRDNLVIAPNLWAGIGLVRGGAGTALVGSHDEVAARIEEYRAVGISEFIMSGYPHLEEAYAFGEGVLPLVRPDS